MNDTYSEAFALIADLAAKNGAAPLRQFEACWEHQVDETWKLFINGHREPKKTSHGLDVPAFHCLVEFNGWPAGLIHPYGGEIAAGSAANEDTLIQALRAAGAEA